MWVGCRFGEAVVNGIDAELKRGFSTSRELRVVTSTLISGLSAIGGGGGGSTAAHGISESIDSLAAFIPALGAFLQAQSYPDDSFFTAYPAALADVTNRANAIDFLCSELQAARMIAFSNRKKQSGSNAMQIDTASSAKAAAAAVPATGSNNKMDTSDDAKVYSDDGVMMEWRRTNSRAPLSYSLVHPMVFVFVGLIRIRCLNPAEVEAVEAVAVAVSRRCSHYAPLS